MVRINVFSFQDMQYERKNIFKNSLNIKNNVIYTQMFTSLYFSEFKQWILSSVVPACLYNLYLNRRCKCDHKTNISYIFFLPFNYQVSVLLTIYHQKVLNLKKMIWRWVSYRRVLMVSRAHRRVRLMYENIYLAYLFVFIFKRM